MAGAYCGERGGRWEGKQAFLVLLLLHFYSGRSLKLGDTAFINAASCDEALVEAEGDGLGALLVSDHGESLLTSVIDTRSHHGFELPADSPDGALLAYDLLAYRTGRHHHAVRMALPNNGTAAAVGSDTRRTSPSKNGVKLRSRCVDSGESLCPRSSINGEECSGNGDCISVNGTKYCDCNDGRLGIACERDDSFVMQLNVSDSWSSITVHSSQWRFFRVQPQSLGSSGLLVELRKTSINGDPILFAKRLHDGFLPADVPVIEDFTKHSARNAFNARQTQHFVRVAPLQGLGKNQYYLIGVYNAYGFAAHGVADGLQLRARSGENCPFDCNGADCDPNCECPYGRAGPACIGKIESIKPDGSSSSFDVEIGGTVFVEIDFSDVDFSDISEREEKYMILRLRKWSYYGIFVVTLRVGDIPAVAEDSNSNTETYTLVTDAATKTWRDFRISASTLRIKDKLYIALRNPLYEINRQRDVGKLQVEVRASIRQSTSLNGGQAPFYSALLGVSAALIGCVALATCRHMSQRLGLLRLQTNMAGSAGDAGGSSSQERGLSEAAIARIPEPRYQAGMLPEEEATCSICLDNFKPGDQLKHPHASHYFHKSCLQEWLRSSAMCPLCRTELTGEEQTILGRISSSLRRSLSASGEGIPNRSDDESATTPQTPREQEDRQRRTSEADMEANGPLADQQVQDESPQSSGANSAGDEDGLQTRSNGRAGCSEAETRQRAGTWSEFLRALGLRSPAAEGYNSTPAEVELQEQNSDESEERMRM